MIHRVSVGLSPPTPFYTSRNNNQNNYHDNESSN